MLGSHPDIATASELWILLPYLYSLKEEGVYAEYGHRVAYIGCKDFIDLFPNKENDFFSELHDFIIALYSKASSQNEEYFLDKTPRYHLVAEEIIRIFPEGRFIFLWRNPLSVVASIINTWGKGKWNVYRFYIDLYMGLENLIHTYQKYRNNVYTLSYEKLVAEPVVECQKLFGFLDIDPFCVSENEFFNSTLVGRLGDPTGSVEYTTVSSEPLNKWRDVLGNPIRQWWCRRYLDWIGTERMATMGYELTILMSALAEIQKKTRYIFSDLIRFVYGTFYTGLELRMMRDKFSDRRCFKYFHY